MPRLSLVPVLAVLFATGCSNALNPFCGNVRPAPLIGSLSPSTVTFAQVQQGVTLTVNGNQFVSASQLVINGKTLGPTVISSQKLSILLTTGEISGPGPVNVSVLTPSGNSGDVGCSSGGKSSVLTLTVTQ